MGAQPHFAPLVAAGEFVFVSGQFGATSSGTIEGDVAQQTLQCLSNIEALIGEVGLSRSDIVKTTVWLRHAADFWDYDRAYGSFFGPHRPARSTLICELARPEAIVEVEAIARDRRHGSAPGPRP